jgi:hypothetical protein
MFERMENGWAMVKQSWSVLKLDKELLVFPLIGGLAWPPRMCLSVPVCSCMLRVPRDKSSHGYRKSAGIPVRLRCTALTRLKSSWNSA